MKKILNIISWTLFYLMAAAAVVAAISSAVGLGVLFIAICCTSTLLATVLKVCAAGYFISLAIMLMVYVILCVYRVIESKVRNRR